MTLRVPYEGFVAAVEQELTSRHVYLHSQSGRVLLTAGEAKHSVVIVSSCRKSADEVRRELHAAGLHAHNGLWSVDDDQEILGLPFVASVSYRATKDRTGVWVDAYASAPTEAEVVQDFFAEISLEQNLPEMSLDDFITNAQVSVSIVSPTDLEKFLGNKNA